MSIFEIVLRSHHYYRVLNSELNFNKTITIKQNIVACTANEISNIMIYVCGVNPRFKCTFCQKHLRHHQSLICHMATIYDPRKSRVASAGEMYFLRNPRCYHIFFSIHLYHKYFKYHEYRLREPFRQIRSLRMFSNRDFFFF